MQDNGTERTGRSVDKIGLIRRSLRCWRFGLVGLLPLAGTGFAWQALRIRRRVSADLEENWKPPPVYIYWLVGTAATLPVDANLDIGGDLLLLMVLLAVQSWHCWRSFPRLAEPIWNPAGRHLTAGTLCAYLGLGLSLWTVVVSVLAILKASAPV
jgi:hypothetical protein